MVKKIIGVLMLLFCLVTVGISQNIAGTWKGTGDTPQGKMDLTFNFKVDDKTVTGSIESPMGAMDVSDGKVIDDKNFEFSVVLPDFTLVNKCEFKSEDEIHIVTDMLEMTINRVK